MKAKNPESITVLSYCLIHTWKVVLEVTLTVADRELLLVLPVMGVASTL